VILPATIVSVSRCKCLQVSCHEDGCMCVERSRGTYRCSVPPASRLPWNSRTKTIEVHVDEVERSSG
jgi:hypothetical protein